MTTDANSSQPIRHHSQVDGALAECVVLNRLKLPPIEDEQTRMRLEKACEIALSSGYRKAIEQMVEDKEYVLNEARLVIVDFLNINREMDVLEIGASLGQMTVSIANRARSVTAIEVVEGQARFAAERCRQEGVDNATFICGGDDCMLPVEDQQYDLVMMNLVFEWCSRREVDGNGHDVSFEQGQERILRECYRVLKPGGRLFLSTKNRFSLHLLFGKPDEHAFQMRFGNALPRWVMKQRLRTQGHQSPTGLLHSYSALNRKIIEAGFSSTQPYWLAPEMRYPTHVIPADAASVCAARRQSAVKTGNYRSTRPLLRWMPASWVKYVAPALCSVAIK